MRKLNCTPITDSILIRKSNSYLHTLCHDITERCVGSDGNRQASLYFRDELLLSGWKTELQEFNAIDWKDGGASLKVEDQQFNALVSPYSTSFKGAAELVAATSVSELESLNSTGKIILLRGDIAREQLMPRNFVFYNPEEHQKIISLLDNSGAKALICATGRKVFLESVSERIPGNGYNVIGRKGTKDSGKIVVTAHIDAKKGTPGAIDNATGVIILLLLADLLKDYEGEKMIELVALNGEDYYAVPGQMKYIAVNQGSFNTVMLNINIDGAGYKEGPSAFSLFDLPDNVDKATKSVMENFPAIKEGIKWPQGDHSIFLQYGIPAIAVSSKWFIDNISDQDITHTPKDNPEIVDCNKLVEIARALDALVRKL